VAEGEKDTGCLLPMKERHLLPVDEVEEAPSADGRRSSAAKSTRVGTALDRQEGQPRIGRRERRVGLHHSCW